MSTRNKIVKPKSSSKPVPSPEPYYRNHFVIVTPTPHTNTEHFNNPNSPSSPRFRLDIPKRPTAPKQTPPPVPSKPIKQQELASNCSSSLVGSEIEREDLLQLQIKQLKRQNAFLKKKIQEMTSDYQMFSPKKKKAPKEKGFSPPNIESLHLTVGYFFKEIANLLNSVEKLFKLTIKEEETNFTKKCPPELDNLNCPLQREFLFKKYILNRKLEKIILEDEHKKYAALLDLFNEYYKYKEEADHRILASLDEMIQKTNELNKWLIEKAQIKKLKSQVQSTSQKDSLLTPDRGNFAFRFLRAPENHMNNRLTFSPSTKHTQTYKRNVELSP